MEPKAETADKPEKGGLHLSAKVVEIARKLLPYLLGAIITAGFKLYYDNIGNMRDIGRNTWWNQEQDARIKRLETQRDEDKAIITDLIDNQREFHPVVLERLERIKEILERRKQIR